MKRLNIGCGHRTIDGYHNVDCNPELPNLTFVAPMDNIPCEDNTYREVFASHVIEHVSIANARKALKEWYRVLEPKGELICDTPNLQLNAELYLENSNRWLDYFNNFTEAEKQYCSLNGVPNKTLFVNFKMFSSDAQWDTHFANYDAELLKALYIDAGFSSAEVQQLSPSLIVKAIK